jgi:TetR/AcrR family fatty acid metabolism transcriptional regulator
MPSEISSINQITEPKRSFIEEARRAQIIECAIDTIAEQGFAQASLSRIAGRAGISPGVISYYFAGKDALIAEVVARVFQKGAEFIGPRVNARETARQALRTFVEASVAYVAAYPNYTRAVMNIMRAGRADGGELLYHASLEGPRRDGFTSILEWGQRTGEFRAFPVSVMVMILIEAVDAVPPLLAETPDLDLAAYALELGELFDRATRADPKGDGL